MSNSSLTYVTKINLSCLILSLCWIDTDILLRIHNDSNWEPAAFSVVAHHHQCLCNYCPPCLSHSVLLSALLSSSLLLPLTQPKSSSEWLTMLWLARFLVGLLWSNLPLMTCYLRSCLSSMGKNFFWLPSCCQISLKKWIFRKTSLISSQLCSKTSLVGFIALPFFEEFNGLLFFTGHSHTHPHGM